jgi:penicillin-binding protein 1A
MRSTQKSFDNHWSGQNPWVDESGKEIPGFIDSVAKRTEYYKALVKRYPKNPDSVLYQMKNVKRKMWVYSRNTLGEEQQTMSAYDSIQYYKRFLQAGMMTLDPYTGHIKAWVGGLDFKYFKYDHVKQSKRQAGSTFKPFVYTAAIDGPRDLSPCFAVEDAPYSLEIEENGEKKIWSPHNADGTFSYSLMPLKRALAKSVNTVTARLTNDLVGPDTVMYYAQKMGIKSPLKPVASIGLGSFDVSLFEMIGAYSAFVNEGIHVEPMLVTEIKDQNGKVIQFVFTFAKLFALGALIVLGIYIGLKTDVFAMNFADAWKATKTVVSDGGSISQISLTGWALVGALGATIINSLFSADAWNNVTFIAGEIKDQKKNIPKSLFFGTLIVTVI